MFKVGTDVFLPLSLSVDENIVNVSGTSKADAATGVFALEGVPAALGGATPPAAPVVVVDPPLLRMLLAAISVHVWILYIIRDRNYFGDINITILLRSPVGRIILLSVIASSSTGVCFCAASDCRLLRRLLR